MTLPRTYFILGFHASQVSSNPAPEQFMFPKKDHLYKDITNIKISTGNKKKTTKKKKKKQQKTNKQTKKKKKTHRHPNTHTRIHTHTQNKKKLFNIDNFISDQETDDN